jgi:tocopherol cyclase
MGGIREGGLPGTYDLKKIWNPSWFQGNRARDKYFEGWYFKQVSADGEHSLAFIPGISLAGGDDHSFVQAIDGKTGETWYFRYPLEDFAYSKSGFSVRVGDNRFSADGMALDLSDGTTRFRGKLTFSGQVRFRAGLRKPGIMGWYRYAPFMECYHGVVSLDHGLQGALQINEREVPFNGGRGYIEKDWGKSMPGAWIWMQTNHFESPGTSFMLSIADIPWIGRSFTGFLGFLLHAGKRHDFATYTGARILSVEDSAGELLIRIGMGDHRLQVTGKKSRTGSLKAPLHGSMQRMIHESIDSSIHILLHDAAGNPLFEGTGQNAGLEMVGNVVE